MAKTCWVDKWFQFRDANGILAGGVITTFTTGTATPLAHYTNASGSGSTTSTTIPPNGRAAIWLDENVGYRIKIVNSSGTLIKQYDNVYGRMNVDLDGTIQDSTISLSAFVSQTAPRLFGSNGSGTPGTISVTSNFKVKSNYLTASNANYRKISSDALLASTGGADSTILWGAEKISAGYKTITLNIFNLALSNATLKIQFSPDGGTTYRTVSSDYVFSCHRGTFRNNAGVANSLVTYGYSSSNNGITLFYDASNTAGGTNTGGSSTGGKSNITVTIWDHADSSKKTKITVESYGLDATSVENAYYYLTGYLNYTEITNAIKLTYQSNSGTGAVSKTFGIGNND